jgi:hypothetical protein
MEFHSEPHPVHWFRDQFIAKKLILKPPYQRKPVWAARQKNALIESLLMNVPVPEIYIHETLTEEEQASTDDQYSTINAIVDGQQRMRAVLQFLGYETEPGEQEFLEFSLDKLEATSPWHGLTYKKLPQTDQKRFISYKFQCRILKTEDEGEVRQMFRRLNQFQMALKPQELRNAIYIGPFVQVANTLADDPFWTNNRIFTPQSLRRMSDVEFTSELLIGILHGPQAGNARAIDEFYVQYEDYDDEFPEQQVATEVFKATLTIITTLFPDLGGSGTRWRNRADLYSLFLVIAEFLRGHATLPPSQVVPLRKELERFSDEVNDRLADDHAKTRKPAREYARAVEKGVNDRHRRAIRHDQLEVTLHTYFKFPTK